MKKLLTITLFILLQLSTFAQDKIVKVDGSEVSGRILEITLQEIFYRHPDSLQLGITWSMPKSEVFMVQFENGTKEVYEEHLPGSKANERVEQTSEQRYRLGKEDALQFYKGNGAMWGSAASTMVMFPFGLAGSIVIGATPPKVQSHRVSDARLLSDPAYVQGYREQAHRKKKGKALAGVGIGVGVQLTLVMLVLAAYR